jgi:cobalt/nickel transport system permease protein
MHHSYIDKYADLDSVIHKADARLKITAAMILILLIVLSGPSAYLSFILYGSVLLAILAISGIPFLFIFKKTLVVIPFVILMAVFIPFIKEQDGSILFRGIVIRAYLAILCMTLLISSTEFASLLKGLEQLKVPKIFIMIMSFMYRYLFLLIDETQRMQRAKDSRSFGKTGCLRLTRFLSNIIGVLFVRSYERAERVYLAMCSRGFNGSIKTAGQAWKK